MLQDLAILLLLGRLIHKLFQAHSMVSHSPNLKQYTGTHATLEMTTGFNSRRIHTLDVVGHVALPRPVLDVDARQLLGLLASVREGLSRIRSARLQKELAVEIFGALERVNLPVGALFANVSQSFVFVASLAGGLVTAAFDVIIIAGKAVLANFLLGLKIRCQEIELMAKLLVSGWGVLLQILPIQIRSVLVAWAVALLHAG
mmetsp:Transcript_9363/g.26864  ORF Transcript_9363/g.26864 Transcript_9363/m.26864 type:complete len:202 (+) Transcript_9363:228-833(+)